MLNEHTEKLLQLVKENPELPIETATHYEVCAGDEHSYWKGEIYKIEVNYSYCDDERWFCDSEDILEHLHYQYSDEELYKDLTDDEYNKIIDDKFEELLKDGEIVKAIIIFINV